MSESRGFIGEFKAFALRGNLFDLAIAFILGVAFSAVVQALVNAVLLQLVAAVAGRPSFDALSFYLGDTPMRYGEFLTALVNFVTVTLVLFLIVRSANRVLHPHAAPTEPPRTRDCSFCFTAIPLQATRCSGCTSEVEPAGR